MSLSLSRRQLAAALLEYDNDPDDPTYNRSARDSALFISNRRPEPPQLPPQLSLDIRPSSVYSGYGHLSPAAAAALLDRRRDDALAALEGRARFQGTPGLGKPDEAREDIVDAEDEGLGIPEHLLSPTETDATARIPLHRISTGVASPVSPLVERRSIHLDRWDQSGSHSPMRDLDKVEEVDEFGAKEALSAAERVRRLAEGIPLPETPGPTMRHFPDTVRNTIRRMSLGAGQATMIPLPESPSSSVRPLSAMSRPVSGLSRPFSAMRFDDAEDLYEDGNEDVKPNPFALPAPPAEMGSRFDPKVLAHQRRPSSSMSANPGRPPSVAFSMNRDAYHEDHNTARASIDTQFRPLLRASKTYSEIPTAEEFGRPLLPSRYSAMPTFPTRNSLLRPKTLLMPRPLSTLVPPPKIEKNRNPEGWTVGEKPLPAQARSSILLGADHGGWGKMDVNRLKIEPREEQWEDVAEMTQPVEDDTGGVEDLHELERVQQSGPRGPGRLYGTSLMDQLESRKQIWKGKQRVFTGDNRPSMMSRSGHSPSHSMDRPVSAGSGPTSGPVSPNKRLSSQTDLNVNRPPLLQFDSNGDLRTTARDSLGPAGFDRMTKSRSVFGVDQIWEREMAKLKTMQEEDRVAAEAEAARRAAEDARKGRKQKGKGKEKARDQSLHQPDHQPFGPDILERREEPDTDHLHLQAQDRNHDSAPTLNFLPPTGEIPSLPSFEPSPLPDEMQPKRAGSRMGLEDWADSSDDEGRPLSLMPKSRQSAPSQAADDSDEDVPLSKIVPRTSLGIVTRGLMQAEEEESSDDEDGNVPLSQLRKSPVKSPIAGGAVSRLDRPLELGNAFGSGSLGLDIPSETAKATTSTANDNDDDDVPLLWRRQARQSTTPAQDTSHPIDDDLPLAYKRGATTMPSANPPTSFMPAMLPAPAAYPAMTYPWAPYPNPMSVYGGVMPFHPPPQVGFGQPVMGPAGAEVAIDRWRQEVAVAPGSSGSVASVNVRSAA